jgi:hypothetical protein
LHSTIAGHSPTDEQPGIFGVILEGKLGDPEVLPKHFFGSYTRMPSEPQPDAAPAEEGQGSASHPDSAEQLPGELSEFSQRLASFGLGESPDPLLTEARPPAKRRMPI